MGIFDRIYGFRQREVRNSYPNEVRLADISAKEPDNPSGKDLYEITPSHINRTVRNCRYATRDPQVHGVLLDIMVKSNTHFEIIGDNEQAVNHIKKMDEDYWNINKIIDEMFWKGAVDGQAFMNLRIKENHICPRWLEWDGESYNIMEIYDSEEELLGYKQVIQKNAKTNNGWLRRKFDELKNESSEEVEINFEPSEVIHMKYLERDGIGHSLVVNVLDDVMYKRKLKELMTLTVYKNSNLVVVTMGNEDKMNTYLDEDARNMVVETVSDFDHKGAVVVPYGIDLEVLKGGTLPEIQDYLKYYERCIYVGLNTPEAVFNSESSNRATADIQLDSKTSGRILFFQYNQEWVTKYIEELFRRELELQGISGYVTIEFENLTEDEDEDENSDDTNPESLHKPITKKGQEDIDKTGTTGIKKTTTNTDNVHNDVKNRSQTNTAGG